MSYEHVEWLLSKPPREVQLEAISRSHYGIKVKDDIQDQPEPYKLNGNVIPYRGYAYFMEMRLGKTAAALNQYMLLKRDYEVKVHLVLSPNSFKSSWKTESEEFGVDVPTIVFESSQRGYIFDKISKLDEFQLIVNYQALIYDNTMRGLEELVNTRRVMLSCDESVLIKNRSATSTKRTHFLAKRAKYVRILTGKPMVQGPHDIWSQLRTIGGLDGSNFFGFRNTFCLMGGFRGKVVVGAKNEDRLAQIIKANGFWTKRSEWAKTYKPDYEIIKVSMEANQAKAYREFDEEFMLMLGEDNAISVDQAITKALKLQQISSGFIYDEYKDPHILVPMDKLPKFLELKDRIENQITGKIIVICLFNYTIDRLLQSLAPYGCAVIRGGMGPEKAEEEKRRFNEDSAVRVLVAQIKSIKYGHKLMGSPEIPCLDMAYFENSYSLDDRSQSEERNQGVDQVAQTHVMDFVTCPVDKKVVMALQRKEKVAEVIFGHYKDTK